MLTQFKNKIKEKELDLREMENDLNQVKKTKEKQLKEIEEYAEEYRTKIIEESLNETNSIEQSVEFHN